MTEQMPIIIDGHNLLHSIQETGSDVDSIDRLRLCHIVGRYLKITADRATVVFDGAPPPDEGRFGNIGNLEVIFSGPHKEADTVIEDKIRASAAPRRLTVVSSDRRLRIAAKTRKALAMKAEIFWSNLARELGRKKPQKEPLSKQWGLTESETDQWLKFFDLEQ